MVSAVMKMIEGELSAYEIKVLIALERTGGAVSLAAVMLVFLAYAWVPRARNVQNTFIVFASISNVGACVASIIAMDGLYAGKMSPLCQAQSFIFEMFMQSDPWWSLAMAVNVFLVFYFRLSPDSFKRWWWLYCIICYGGPFAFALILLVLRFPNRPPIYGEATIWCWVDSEWDSIRIYTYYMLVWICIIGSLLLYFLVGYHVFRSRNRLRSFSTSKSREAGHHENHRCDLQGVPQDGFYGTVITEVQIVHSKARHPTSPSEAKRPAGRRPTHISFDEPSGGEDQSASGQYFSSVTSQQRQPIGKRSWPSWPRPFRRMYRALQATANRFVIEDPIKRAYLRTSFLFGISVLVTWIPSSLNRIHSWLDGTSPYEYHVATAAVLPLQGLWNAVIFFITSWPAVRAALVGGGGGGGGGEGPADERQAECVERGAVLRDRDEMVEEGAGRRLEGAGRDDSVEYADSGNAGSDVELTRI